MRRLSVLLASAVMALTLIAVAAGVSGAAPNQQPPADHFYGAFYYGGSTDEVYGATGTTQEAAIQAASAACEKAATDCVGIAWVTNGWLAIVYSDTNLWWGFAPTEKEAMDVTLKGCQDAGEKNCQPHASLETAIDPKKQIDGGEIPSGAPSTGVIRMPTAP